jgi:hypothetical protein
VVGRALRVVDLEGLHLQRLRELAGGVQRPLRRARDGTAGAAQVGLAPDDRLERVQAEGVVAEHADRGRAARVSHQRGRPHGLGRRGDLAVGDRQQDHVGGRDLTAAERPLDLVAGGAEARGQAVAHAAASHDSYAGGRTHGAGGGGHRTAIQVSDSGWSAPRR